MKIKQNLKTTGQSYLKYRLPQIQPLGRTSGIVYSYSPTMGHVGSCAVCEGLTVMEVATAEVG